MTVEAQTVEYAYLGDGVTTVFAFPSRFLANADLLVALNGVVQVAGYSVTGAGDPGGGGVTFAVAPVLNARVLLVRSPVASQLIDFVNGQTVLEGVLDNGLDKLTMIAQYLLRAVRRSIRIGDASYTTEDPSLLDLPVFTARLSKILGFDANGKVELIDRAGFEQLMADAIAAAGTATAAASVAVTAAEQAADYLASILEAINGVNSASRRKFTMTAGQTIVPVGVITSAAVFVYYDGVLLDPITEYTIVGTNLTLTAGAAAGALVTVVEFKLVSVTNALIGANSLSDVNDKKAARFNLEITKTMAGPNADASISSDSRVVLINAAFTAPRIYTLPLANSVNPGESVDVIDVPATLTPTNTLAVQRAGADTVNGGTSVVMSVARSVTRFTSDGVSKWTSEAVAQTPRQVVQVFTASGTYTPTPGMVSAVIETLAGGGGGAGATGNASFLTSGGGGGAGAYALKRVLAADVGASQAVTIGAAGAAGAAAGNGGNGGDTSVGSLCIAKGGSGGAAGTSGSFGTGGAGGLASASTGDFKVNGSTGETGPYGTIAGGYAARTAPGGVAAFGGFSGQTLATGGAIANGGAAVANTGCGGNGGVSNFVATNSGGGAGGSGIVRITELVLG